MEPYVSWESRVYYRGPVTIVELRDIDGEVLEERMFTTPTGKAAREAHRRGLESAMRRNDQRRLGTTRGIITSFD